MNPRLAPIVVAVVCAHGLALWALQAAFRRTEPQAETAIVMVASLVDPVQPVAPAPPPPPAPAKAPAPPAPRKAPAPAPIPIKPRTEPAPKPVIERETAAAEPASQPEAMTLDNPASESRSPAELTQVSAPIVVATPPTPAPLELPNSNARHLNNPKPPYPTLSKRMGEQGTVVIRAWIELDGTASRAEV
ncbi:MAG TPA: energy transducer TonB, partial [Hydrogenophaga sp.]